MQSSEARTRNGKYFLEYGIDSVCGVKSMKPGWEDWPCLGQLTVGQGDEMGLVRESRAVKTSSREGVKSYPQVHGFCWIICRQVLLY